MAIDDKTKIKDKVDKAMRLFDDVESIEGNPFLFTRVKTALETQPEKTRFRSLFAPVPIQFAFVIVLLILNLFSVGFFISRDNTSGSKENSFMVTLTSDYYLNLEDDILNNLQERE